MASRRVILILAKVLKQTLKSMQPGAPSSPSNAQEQSMLSFQVCLQNLCKTNSFAPWHPKSHFTWVKIIEKPLDVCKKCCERKNATGLLSRPKILIQELFYVTRQTLRTMMFGRTIKCFDVMLPLLANGFSNVFPYRCYKTIVKPDKNA